MHSIKTSTLGRQKIGLFYVKYNAQFNKLFKSLSLKAIRSGERMAKTKVVRKNANWLRSEGKG